MLMIHPIRRQKGFSLLEVLIALVLFSIALIGFAGAVTVAMRSGQTATMRTQAVFLAQMMENKMRSNSRGVIAGAYTGTFSLASGAPSTDCTSGCSPAQLAAFDTLSWGQALGRAMPNGTGSIRCNLTPVPPSGVDPSPRGLCTVSITWSEQVTEGMRGDSTGVREGRFDWVFNS